MQNGFFDRLVWADDRMLADDLVFRLQQVESPSWEHGDECLTFFKIKALVDQYERFFRGRELHPESILEIGIWDGGSLAFWNLLFTPQKHVGVDLAQRTDSAYFRRFVAEHGGEAHIKTYWGVDQADAPTMQSIIAAEFTEPIELVIDDGSHKYAPTKASFETIFPHLQPGGLYVIEDWAWAHWSAFQSPEHKWATEEPLTTLIVELTEVLGSTTDIIAGITVFQGFAAIERGPAPLSGDFKLSAHITRRPGPRSFPKRATRRLVVRTKRLASRLRSHA